MLRSWGSVFPPNMRSSLIGEIVREASCPVIALLHANDPAYIHEAAKRGVFAYIIDGGPDELQSAIDITLQRFTEYQSLQGAFGRRAMIEQAKGILMSRHSIDATRAFGMIRDHSQHNGRKLVDVAQAMVEAISSSYRRRNLSRGRVPVDRVAALRNAARHASARATALPSGGRSVGAALASCSSCARPSERLQYLIFVSS